MAGVESVEIGGRALSNHEAAVLIEMILDNTSTAVPARVQVPDTPQSLADLFPEAVLVRV